MGRWSLKEGEKNDRTEFESAEQSDNDNWKAAAQTVKHEES